MKSICIYAKDHKFYALIHIDIRDWICYILALSSSASVSMTFDNGHYDTKYEPIFPLCSFEMQILWKSESTKTIL